MSDLTPSVPLGADPRHWIRTGWSWENTTGARVFIYISIRPSDFILIAVGQLYIGCDRNAPAVSSRHQSRNATEHACVWRKFWCQENVNGQLEAKTKHLYTYIPNVFRPWITLFPWEYFCETSCFVSPFLFCLKKEKVGKVGTLYFLRGEWFTSLTCQRCEGQVGVKARVQEG